MPKKLSKEKARCALSGLDPEYTGLHDVWLSSLDRKHICFVDFQET